MNMLAYLKKEKFSCIFKEEKIGGLDVQEIIDLVLITWILNFEEQFRILVKTIQNYPSTSVTVVGSILLEYRYSSYTNHQFFFVTQLSFQTVIYAILSFRTMSVFSKFSYTFCFRLSKLTKLSRLDIN